MHASPSSEFVDQAFERIEARILPGIAMLLESVIDVAAGVGERDRAAFASELRTISADLDRLTQAVGQPRAEFGETIRSALG